VGAEGAGEPQFPGGFGKFDLDPLSASLIAAIHPFPILNHSFLILSAQSFDKSGPHDPEDHR
jgi:hypothetical protein